VDIGAHIGTFTLLAAYAILNAHNDGLVISVEPVSVNYVALLNNVMLNNVEKYVHPIRAAIASKSGLAEIEWIGRNEKGRAMTMHEIVDIVNGFYSHIDLVKMDVEGAELDILTNNNDWLKHVNSMVMELHPQVYGLKQNIESLRRSRFSCKGH
jgi:FkbM family methyltransferase